MRLTPDRELQRLADLLGARNTTEIEITQIIGRPAQIGHIGEYIASRMFDIALEPSAVHPGSDGHFNSGPLAGKSVNIRMYGKREGLLDIRREYLPDYYLVFTGPKSTTMDSKGTTRPWGINEVFLLEAQPLIDRLRARGVKLGVATSVREEEWKAARIFPASSGSPLKLTHAQQGDIRLFELS